jgi:hypothetical protein
MLKNNARQAIQAYFDGQSFLTDIFGNPNARHLVFKDFW